MEEIYIKNLKSRRWILKNTSSQALNSVVGYLCLLFYVYLILNHKVSKGSEYVYAIFTPIFIIAAIIHSKGYLLDLLFKNTIKVEGELIDKENIYSRMSSNVIGNKNILRTSRGKIVTVAIYNNVYEESERTQNLDDRDIYRSIYHCLFLSKIVVYIEYIKRNEKQ